MKILNSKGPENMFNKIIEENFPNLKKEKAINILEFYRTPNRLDQKRINLLPQSNQNTKPMEQRQNIKSC